MAKQIFSLTAVLLFCGVFCGSFCKTPSVKKHADLEIKYLELEGKLELLDEKIESINKAFSRLLEESIDADQSHDVKKRQVVISSNILPDLSLEKLASVKSSLGKEESNAETGGTVYTRWGRRECGNDSTLLYSGYAGGSNFDQPGGGVNYQCMPLDPQYNRFYSGSAPWYGSYMAGVEYESAPYYGIFPKSAHQQNAPCARCYTNNRTAVMMIPAKRDCANGWTKEYEGYLMAQYYNHQHSTTFECVDSSPEYIEGQGADNNGAMFYFIRTQCNRGGHCPPYDSNKELTCVVCSK